MPQYFLHLFAMPMSLYLIFVFKNIKNIKEVWNNKAESWTIRTNKQPKSKSSFFFKKNS